MRAVSLAVRTLHVLISMLLLGCQAEAPEVVSTQMEGSEAAQSDDAKILQVVGIVQKVDRDRGLVIIKHEAIEGFMDAMTMPFPVEKPELLAG